MWSTSATHPDRQNGRMRVAQNHTWLFCIALNVEIVPNPTWYTQKQWKAGLLHRLLWNGNVKIKKEQLFWWLQSVSSPLVMQSSEYTVTFPSYLTAHWEEEKMWLRGGAVWSTGSKKHVRAKPGGAALIDILSYSSIRPPFLQSRWTRETSRLINLNITHPCLCPWKWQQPSWESADHSDKFCVVSSPTDALTILPRDFSLSWGQHIR